MAIHPMLAMIAIKKVQARILGDGMEYRTPSDARTEVAVEEAGSLYPLTVSHPNHWWEPMRCYPFVIEAMDQKHNLSWYATQQVRCYSEQLFTATEVFYHKAVLTSGIAAMGLYKCCDMLR